MVSAALKRGGDVAAASLLLVLLSPLLALTGILVASRMGHPVLFIQQRPGRDRKPFHLLKFRTMRDAVDLHGRTLPDGERLTRLGIFLRATSIDELPALWNVIRGDMSLVGPRPLLMDYLPLYSPEQDRRHLVRPGLSGWAQVNGRNEVSWKDRFAMDIWYIDNKSFWLDLKILRLTASKVIRRDGVSAPGEATMSRFMGNDMPK